jgi:hypothetical protein
MIQVARTYHDKDGEEAGDQQPPSGRLHLFACNARHGQHYIHPNSSVNKKPDTATQDFN